MPPYKGVMEAEAASALVHATSWTTGWALVLCGFVSGALLGLGFHRADFWGGYGSFRRRLTRLGHIAFVALGVLNLLFALSPWPAAASSAASVAASGFAIGGFAMPLVCFLTAWKERFRHLFFIPVLSLVIGAATILWETF